LGEIRGGEAFLLQLLNTGHSGTLSTVHANSAAQDIPCFTTCVLQSGVEMSLKLPIAKDHMTSEQLLETERLVVE
jgi:pilus assembly protein CpaF